MARELFLVAQTGGVPTFIFKNVNDAQTTLRAEFWELPSGEFRSADDRWTGRLAARGEVGRLLGWDPERAVAA